MALTGPFRQAELSIISERCELFLRNPCSPMFTTVVFPYDVLTVILRTRHSLVISTDFYCIVGVVHCMIRNDDMKNLVNLLVHEARGLKRTHALSLLVVIRSVQCETRPLKELQAKKQK